jgi:hypothetical protein
MDLNLILISHLKLQRNDWELIFYFFIYLNHSDNKYAQFEGEKQKIYTGYQVAAIRNT